MKILECIFRHKHKFTPRYDKVFNKDAISRIISAKNLDFSEMLETIYVKDVCSCGATIERQKNGR